MYKVTVKFQGKVLFDKLVEAPTAIKAINIVQLEQKSSKFYMYEARLCNLS